MIALYTAATPGGRWNTVGTMEVIEYRDLDMYQVDGMLSQNGEVLVSLPERHAYACIAFIEMVRAVKGGSRDRVPLLVRVWRVLQGVLTILRVLIAHRRLLELSRVIILNTSVQTWERTGEGSFLFRFVR
jgi:hypothetical protein